MEINKKNRTDLKGYFLAGVIPTQKNFEEFIDANLNQAEDGIAKVQGSPIALQAEGDSAGTQEVLALYSSFSDANPNWAINLNPRVDPNLPGSNKPGLNFTDPIGVSQLFIKSAGGNVGIGTIEPASRLSIQSREDASMISVISETSGSAHIFEVSQEEGNGVLSVREGNGTLVSKLSGSASKPGFFLSKVGVGTDNPEANLHVSGEAAELRITNTKSGQSPRLSIQGSNGKFWDISNDEQDGNVLSIHPSETGEKGITISRDGTLNALGGVNFGERSDHANRDASMYRLGGKLYLSIDDHFFIRDVGGNEKMHFASNAGRMAIGGKDPQAPLSISGTGKDGSPDSSMHITGGSILFGGANAGGSSNSAKIMVGADKVLKIYGQSTGTNPSTRKLEISAQGGLTIHGKTNINGHLTVDGYLKSSIQHVVAFSVSISSNSLSGSRNPQFFGHKNYDPGINFIDKTHFKAPVKGLYLFTMTISKAGSPSGHCYWTLRLNGSGYVNGLGGSEKHERGLVRASASTHSTSRTVITHLNAGDKVHIQQTGSSRPDNYSSGFEGVLLQAFE